MEAQIEENQIALLILHIARIDAPVECNLHFPLT